MHKVSSKLGIKDIQDDSLALHNQDSMELHTQSFVVLLLLRIQVSLKSTLCKHLIKTNPQQLLDKAFELVLELDFAPNVPHAHVDQYSNHTRRIIVSSTEYVL